MTEPLKIPDLAEVLAEVNRLRVERGIGEPLSEMPKGRQHQPDCCPVACALRNGADVRFYPGSEILFGGVDSIHPPEVLSRFAYRFDQGRYPELIA